MISHGAFPARATVIAALAIIVTAAVIGTTALAHHSPVAYDLDVTDFTLTGTIVSVDVRNPHSIIELRVASGDGDGNGNDEEAVWQIEFSSVNLLIRRGWDIDRLEDGIPVTCIGNPSARGRNEMYMWSIVLEDGTEFGR